MLDFFHISAKLLATAVSMLELSNRFILLIGKGQVYYDLI